MRGLQDQITTSMARREQEFGRSMTPVEIAQGVIAALPSMVRPLVWDHVQGRQERWDSAGNHGRIFLHDDGTYQCGMTARYEALEDAKRHYQRRYEAKVMKEHFGVRIEP